MTTTSWPDDVAMALNYARGDARDRMVALMRFDRVLAATVAGAREPSLAQLRLAWWRTQFDAPVAGNEGYDAIIRFGARLLPLIDGWERLLAPLPLDDGSLSAYADGRGATFALLGGDARAGAGWALADFARHCSDAATRDRARALADEALQNAARAQPKPLRVLTAIARSHTITRWTMLRAALS